MSVNIRIYLQDTDDGTSLEWTRTVTLVGATVPERITELGDQLKDFANKASKTLYYTPPAP
jgi:hypothetical protein